MAIKLSQATWSVFAKKRGLEDAALTKALAAFDRSDSTRPEAYGAALAAVSEQLQKMQAAVVKRKAEMDGKAFQEVRSQLLALLDEAERLSKAAQPAASPEADDTLLTARMIPLVREVRQGATTLHALIALAGRESAVLLMRHEIAVSRRKVLAAYLGDAGTPRFLAGTCLLEDGVVTFVVANEVSGLAKRLRAAFLKQTQLRFPVRVRAANGELDLDGAAAGRDALDESGGDGDEAWRARARLAAMATAVQSAAGDQPNLAGKLRALMQFAEGKVAAGEYRAAEQTLGVLAGLLKAPPPKPPLDSAPNESPASGSVFTQARQVWEATRKRVQADLEALETAIIASYLESPALPALSRGVRQFDRVLDLFDLELAKRLDEAVGAVDAVQREAAITAARDLIDQYQGHLTREPLLQELDSNPFLPVKVRASLETSLRTLQSKLL
ncbi:MAG: hypothetical protein KGI67_07680 [Pseudomonadota bacterium]|nr:hypothetical protein [Pseudomonadota bacterium]